MQDLPQFVSQKDVEFFKQAIQQRLNPVCTMSRAFLSHYIHKSLQKTYIICEVNRRLINGLKNNQLYSTETITFNIYVHQNELPFKYSLPL